MMKLIPILLFSIPILFGSCTSQSASSLSNSIGSKQNSGSELGEVVSELDKRIWIIFQDKNKQYWFGSNGNGLYRYDGKTILHFSKKDGLTSDSIRGLQEDKWGNLFISSLGGVNKFDGEIITTLPIIEQNEWELDSNDLWFYTLGRTGEKGPYRYDGTSLFHLKFPKHYLEDEYVKKSPNRPWSPYEVYSIYKDKTGNVWFGTGNFGLCRYDGKTISWMYEDHLTLIEGGGSFGIRSMIEDQQGKFWICNTSYRYEMLPTNTVQQNKTLIDYKRETGIDNLKEFGVKNPIYFLSSVIDKQGDMWLVTYNQGVWKYDGKKISHFEIKEGSKQITLFSIYKDKQDNLWLTSNEAGVYKFNGSTFEKFEP